MSRYPRAGLELVAQEYEEDFNPAAPLIWTLRRLCVLSQSSVYRRAVFKNFNAASEITQIFQDSRFGRN